MIITLQSRPCPHCHVENELDAAQCHSCGQALRCARAQVLEMPLPSAPEKPNKAMEKSKVAVAEKSVIKRCLAKLQAKKYDISSLHFE
ncbi:hypothetical protein [Abditibacterium utsteinense]|uniref:hypothetical protein n=1 Tax=Abditibacterium utsteinense TaxID=1960156 RepID=UPI000F499135|nr:hypothetical protein [Abditibacterium utsteinense]